MIINDTQSIESNLDQSVNFISKGKFPGYLEARYVKRSKDYIIAYLSSQTGCKQACRMCHLTTSGQTSYDNVDYNGFIYQAKQVLDYYEHAGDSVKVVHYNFMSRGEPLANPLLYNSYNLFETLGSLAKDRGLFPKFNISTIMPKCMGNKSLTDIFPMFHPNIYYSIYSMNSDFRKKWLSKAKSAEEGLDLLVEWQELTKKIPKLHWAFIEGENDSIKDVIDIGRAISKRKLVVDINIVRYNPFSNKYGKESPIDKIENLRSAINNFIPGVAKIIPRVGFDVKASCGMFIND